MERHFAKDLEHLNASLVAMGQKVEEMIRAAVRALVERQDDLTRVVFTLEGEVNHAQLAIDEFVLKLLATQQPVAADLRFLVAAMKINGELERVADQAVNIAQQTLLLLKEPPLKPLIDLPAMAEEAMKMVRGSLEAYLKRDPLEAKGVIMADDRVDGYKDQIFRELLTYMMADPTSIPRALALVLISRNLERVGDHATNIAEDVIYMVQGVDVRHPDKGEVPPLPAPETRPP